MLILLAICGMSKSFDITRAFFFFLSHKMATHTFNNGSRQIKCTARRTNIYLKKYINNVLYVWVMNKETSYAYSMQYLYLWYNMILPNFMLNKDVIYQSFQIKFRDVKEQGIHFAKNQKQLDNPHAHCIHSSLLPLRKKRDAIPVNHRSKLETKGTNANQVFQITRWAVTFLKIFI